MSGLSLRLAAVAAGAIAILAPASAAQATNYVDNITIATDSIRCGYFVTNQQCFGYVPFDVAPRNTLAGDTFTINVQFEDRFYVPGSTTSNTVSVLVLDATAVLGGGGPGPYLSQAQMTMLGYEGPPEPLAGTYDFTADAGFGAGGGFCCGSGGLPNNGFSLTGAEAHITTMSDSLRPLWGISAGYAVGLPAAPEVISDLQGGELGAPVFLPPGMVGQITGNIGGEYPPEQFYGFTWSGGMFNTRAVVAGAAPDASFSFKLFDSSGFAVLPKTATPALTEENGYFANITIADLAPGIYRIGLMATTPEDPAFTITFGTPVNYAPASAVPEPATWAMLIAGFGMAGAALRRRRSPLVA